MQKITVVLYVFRKFIQITWGTSHMRLTVGKQCKTTAIKGGKHPHWGAYHPFCNVHLHATTIAIVVVTVGALALLLLVGLFAFFRCLAGLLVAGLVET